MSYIDTLKSIIKKKLQRPSGSALNLTREETEILLLAIEEAGPYEDSQVTANTAAIAALGATITTEQQQYTADDLQFAGPSGSPFLIARSPNANHIVLGISMTIDNLDGILTGTWDINLGYTGQPAMFTIGSGGAASLNFMSSGSAGQTKQFPRATQLGTTFTDTTTNIELAFSADPGTSGDTTNTVYTFTTFFVTFT